MTVDLSKHWLIITLESESNTDIWSGKANGSLGELNDVRVICLIIGFLVVQYGGGKHLETKDDKQNIITKIAWFT